MVLKMLSLWLFLFIINQQFLCFASRQSEEIPPDLLQRIKTSQTREEFFSHLILPPMPMDIPVIKGSVGPRNQIPGAPSIELMSRPPSDPNLEEIENPRQTGDSCQPISICVPLPILKKVGYVYFPQCIDLDQCVGGCCETSHNCHAISKKKVVVRVDSCKYVVTGNQQIRCSNMETIRVEVERHTSCGCANCGSEVNCSPRQQLRNCRCVCDSAQSTANCTGFNRQWVEELCECRCKEKLCPAEQYFHPQHCRCEHIRDVQRAFVQLQSHNPYVSTSSNSDVDRSLRDSQIRNWRLWG